MKKILFVFAMLLAVVTASAGEKTFAVVDGNPSVLKAGGNIVVSFNFEGATYDLNEPLEQHYKNLDELKTKVPVSFMQGFTDKAKKSNIVEERAEAKYSVEVKVNNMDCYYKVMSIVPGHNTKVWGTATIKDNASGETVCVIKITECEGGRDFSIDDSFGKCFIKIGEAIGNLMNKGKL